MAVSRTEVAVIKKRVDTLNDTTRRKKLRQQTKTDIRDIFSSVSLVMHSALDDLHIKSPGSKIILNIVIALDENWSCCICAGHPIKQQQLQTSRHHGSVTTAAGDTSYCIWTREEDISGQWKHTQVDNTEEGLVAATHKKYLRH